MLTPKHILFVIVISARAYTYLSYALCSLQYHGIWTVDQIDFWQIVDSVIALFRVDFSGRGELADRQVCHLHALKIKAPSPYVNFY